MSKITNSKILYKILIDIIVILLFVIATFFVSDFLLKGLLTSYISVGTLFILLIITTTITIAISNIQKIHFEPAKSSISQHFVSIIFIVPFLLLSLKAFPIYMLIPILILSLIIFILIFSLDDFKENHSKY